MKNYIFLISMLLIISCQKVKEKLIIPNKENSEKCISDFGMFFEKFGKDSIYQIDHIKFPLKFSSLSDNYENLEDTVINKNQFSYINFEIDKKAMQFETDKYTVETERNNDIIFYKRLGHDNGILVTYEFKLINDCWYLVHISDEST